MSRDDDNSPGLTVAIVLACLVLAVLILAGKLGNKPDPTPSPSPSPVGYVTDDGQYPYGSYPLCVRLMIDNGFAPELCEPIEPREEDTLRDWSCRMDGNHLCGDTPRWTWGIGLYA